MTQNFKEKIQCSKILRNVKFKMALSRRLFTGSAEQAARRSHSEGTRHRDTFPKYSEKPEVQMSFSARGPRDKAILTHSSQTATQLNKKALRHNRYGSCCLQHPTAERRPERGTSCTRNAWTAGPHLVVSYGLANKNTHQRSKDRTI